MNFRVPSVKASDDGHGAGIWSPNAEDRATLSIARGKMRSHLVVNAVVAAFVEKIEVVLGKQLWAGDGSVIDTHRSGASVPEWEQGGTAGFTLEDEVLF